MVGFIGEATPPRQRVDRLSDQFIQDFHGRLFTGNHADALARHQGAVLHIAVDHGAAQGACPEMLDLKLSLLLIELTEIEPIDHLALKFHEAAGALIGQRPHRESPESADRSERTAPHRAPPH